MPLYQNFSPRLTTDQSKYPVVTVRNYPQNIIVTSNSDMSYDLRNTNFQTNRDKSVYRIPLYILRADDYENIKAILLIR